MTRLKIKISKYIDGHLYEPINFLGDTCVIISHGTNNNMNHPLINAVFSKVVQLNIPVIKFNFSYISQNLNPKDIGWESVDEDLDKVVNFAKDRGYKYTILIGKSLGGITSIRHAAKNNNVAQIIILGFPLKLLDKENYLYFQKIKKRLFIINGINDERCDLDQLKEFIQRYKLRSYLISDANHSFESAKGHSNKYPEVLRIIRNELMNNPNI